MRSFDEWYDGYMDNQPDLDWHDPTQKECYEAGQQSRQEEIDMLQNEVINLKATLEEVLVNYDRSEF